MCTANLASALTTNGTGNNLSLGLGVAGGLFKTVASVNSANSTITADDAQADAMSTNALIAERAAASAVVQGQAEAANASTRGAQVIGAQRAALAANGVDVNSGSAADLQASTQYVTNRDVTTITANAARAAMGYTQQSQFDMNNAASYRRAAASVNPVMSGASTLLGSATDVASTWYRNQRAGT
jgi:hypothetical protein